MIFENIIVLDLALGVAVHVDPIVFVIMHLRILLGAIMFVVMSPAHPLDAIVCYHAPYPDAMTDTLSFTLNAVALSEPPADPPAHLPTHPSTRPASAG